MTCDPIQNWLLIIIKNIVSKVLKKLEAIFTLLIHTVGGYLFTQLVDRAAVIYTVLPLNA